MNYNDFLPQEQQFILQHAKLKETIEECLEDSLNQNPLENGEQDYSVFNYAVKAVKLLIEVARRNLVSGPYDKVHWQLILDHLDFENITEDLDKKFWVLFSSCCAVKKQEIEDLSAEQVYLKGIIEIHGWLPIHELDLGNGDAYDLNTNSVHKLVGVGVHAQFVET